MKLPRWLYKKIWGVYPRYSSIFSEVKGNSTQGYKVSVYIPYDLARKIEQYHNHYYKVLGVTVSTCCRDSVYIKKEWYISLDKTFFTIEEASKAEIDAREIVQKIVNGLEEEVVDYNRNLLTDKTVY